MSEDGREDLKANAVHGIHDSINRYKVCYHHIQCEEWICDHDEEVGGIADGMVDNGRKSGLIPVRVLNIPCSP